MHFFHPPECSNIALFKVTLHYITIIYSILQQLLAVFLCLICILATCAWLGEGRSSQPSCLTLMITLDAAGGWPSYVVGEPMKLYIQWCSKLINDDNSQFHWSAVVTESPPPPPQRKSECVPSELLHTCMCVLLVLLEYLYVCCSICCYAWACGCMQKHCGNKSHLLTSKV